MTKTETTSIYLVFGQRDQLAACSHDFSETAGLVSRDERLNSVSLTFEVCHIPAIEALLNHLYTLRGDFNQDITKAEAIAAEQKDCEHLAA